MGRAVEDYNEFVELFSGTAQASQQLWQAVFSWLAVYRTHFAGRRASKAFAWTTAITPPSI